jgi:hypothetical protein
LVQHLESVAAAAGEDGDAQQNLVNQHTTNSHLLPSRRNRWGRRQSPTPRQSHSRCRHLDMACGEIMTQSVVGGRRGGQGGGHEGRRQLRTVHLHARTRRGPMRSHSPKPTPGPKKFFPPIFLSCCWGGSSLADGYGQAGSPGATSSTAATAIAAERCCGALAVAWLVCGWRSLHRYEISLVMLSTTAAVLYPREQGERETGWGRQLTASVICFKNRFVPPMRLL